MNSKKAYLLLLFLCSIVPSFGQSKYVTVTRSTSLKSGSTSKSKTILRLSETDQLLYLADCNKFYCKVDFDGNIGWVKKHLLENIPVEVIVEEEEIPMEEEAPKLEEKIPLSTEDSIVFEETNDLPVFVETTTSERFSIPWYITLLSFLMVIGLFFLLVKLYQKNQLLAKNNQQLKAKYQGIDNVEAAIQRKTNDYQRVEMTFKKSLEELKKSRAELKTKYRQATEVYHALEKENNLLRNDLEIAEYGVYEPVFNYETSGIFKLKIKEIRDLQKEQIKAGNAIGGGQHWTVDGSAAKGRAMIKKQKKLMMRAFNGECEGHIKNTKWNNVRRMEERVLKSAKDIDKMGEPHGLKLSSYYIELKLKELKLNYEHDLKRHEEKEIQRELQERIRDEEKAKRDYEKAQKEVEKEERMNEIALKRAMEKLGKANEEQKALLNAQIADLQAKLAVAGDKKRALSMAQQTKAGHVYVISNIGSFGEGVYKIGMTRRLDPLDRVKELNSASVPYNFDVHAIISSDNAPALEKELHRQFDNFRLNCVNRRREYFKVSLAEIEKVVHENYGQFEFVLEAEAKEFRESEVMRAQRNGVPREIKNEGKEFLNGEGLFD